MPMEYPMDMGGGKPLTDEEREAILDRNIRFWEKIRKEAFPVFAKYVEYIELSNLQDTIDRAFIHCKACGKTYQWTDWGRGFTAACTRMINHIRREHKADRREDNSRILLLSGLLKEFCAKEEEIFKDIRRRRRTEKYQTLPDELKVVKRCLDCKAKTDHKRLINYRNDHRTDWVQCIKCGSIGGKRREN